MRGSPKFARAFVLCGFVATFSSAVHAGDDYIPGNSYIMVSDVPQADGNIDLLRFDRSRSVPPRPRQAYERQSHFGTWMDPQNDRSCMNVRGLVLVRESRRPVSTIPGQACYVATGLWTDPYTGRTFVNAKDLQIDHVVPLKNAYISGAFAWDWKTRCAYANFMGNRYHLRPVDSSTNQSKGDNTPVRFMPPDRRFACEYLSDWLKIKMTWRLMMSEQEAAVIVNIIRTGGCDVRAFRVSAHDLQQQRQEIARTREICPASPPVWDPQANQLAQ